MYMGSLYKLAPEGEKTDAQFMHVSRTVDSIRAETGTSILIEAHTGHGMQNDRNGNMRPYGSSMWLRWPEFGMAMVHHRDKPVQIKHWRGARSDERDWPGGLRRGEVLPWVPISLDEWNARYE
jgi:replicative DNA helicase